MAGNRISAVGKLSNDEEWYGAGAIGAHDWKGVSAPFALLAGGMGFVELDHLSIQIRKLPVLPARM